MYELHNNKLSKPKEVQFLVSSMNKETNRFSITGIIKIIILHGEK